MSTPAPSESAPTQSSRLGFLKGILGMGGKQDAGSTIEQRAPSGTVTNVTAPHAMGPPAIGHPSPIKIRPERQDSLPELVGTPSDIGVWEVSHELRDNGRFTWKKLFQDPRTYRTDLQSPKKTGQS